MESNTWCPRLTAWIILSGSAVHVKGFGSALCSMTKRSIAACKSKTDRKMPRFKRRFVSLAKKPSTALSQDADGGVKWKVQGGLRANHWRPFGCVGVAQLVDGPGVGGEFELFHPVRLQAVRAPDALDGTRADADDLRHHGGGPVGRLGGWGGLGERHDAFGDARPSGGMREGRVLSCR